jgi:C_GCAxxG_C_C family probable redox protein
MLEEKAAKYYSKTDVERNCSEAVVYGANEEFELHLSDDVLRAMGPFGGGMRIESVCGAITGALAVIGVLYNRDTPLARARMKERTETFLTCFRQRYDCLDCKGLKEKFRDEDRKCEEVVRISARLLQELVEIWTGQIPHG